MSSDGRFSVQYPRPGTAYEVTFDPEGVNVDFTAGDTGRMQFFGQSAQGRTSKQIAEDLVGEKYPNATTDYEIPNALVGYQPGYGVVKDEYPQDASGTFTRLRLLVMVAIKNNYALVAAAIGPYHQFSPGVRQWPPVRGQHATGAGYGQVREQLYLARQLAALVAVLVLGSWNRPMIGMRSMILSRSRGCCGTGGT